MASQPSFCSLPDEVLLGVFAYLSTGHKTSLHKAEVFVLPRVCKRFNALLRLPSPIWHFLDFGLSPWPLLKPHTKSAQSAQALASWLVPRRAAVQRLRITVQTIPVPLLTLGLLSSSLQVVRLDLSDWKDDKLVLLEFLACCRELEEIGIHMRDGGYKYHGDYVEDDDESSNGISVAWLASLAKLCKLDLLVPCTGTLSAQVGKLCPGLTHFACCPIRGDLRHLSVLSGLSSLHVSHNHWSIPWQPSALSGLVSLTRLQMDDIDFEDGDMVTFPMQLQALILNSASLAEIFPVGLSDLKYLEIKHCLSPPPYLECLLSRLPQLTGLSYNRDAIIGYSRHHQSTDIPTTISCLTNLRELGFSGSNITLVPEMLAPLKSLTKISLNCGRFTLPSRCMQQLPLLRALSLDCKELCIQGCCVEALSKHLHDLNALGTLGLGTKITKWSCEIQS